MSLENKYKAALAAHLACEPEQLALYWKGRVGLYAALRACGVGPGDEVIVQAFTCVVVANAIIYTGASPIYVDIKPDSFNASFEEIKKKVSEKTKVIITQNTFGLSTDLERIAAFCTAHSIICIEDCCHGFGGTYHGKSNGSFGDFAFYSTQWNKPFSTGIGGILRVNTPKYISKIEELNASACAPSLKEKWVLETLIRARRYFLNDLSYWTLIKLYRKLTAWKLVIGSSSPDEITAPKLRNNFLKKGCRTQYRQGIKSLKRLNTTLERRKKNAVALTSYLKHHDKTFVSPNFEVNHSFLIYPILIHNRTVFLKAAEKDGLPLGDWFVSPLHPVVQNFDWWGLEIADCPVAYSISSHILNIPLDRKDIRKYFSFLDKAIDQLM